MLELRDYQRRSLDALESYLRLAAAHGGKMAFIHQTERPYRAVPQLPELPYVCLRVPTGGGKTLMACHAVGLAARELLHAEHVVCLWLVPSNTIREQTLAALRNRRHPYREAVDADFSGQVTVLDLSEALYVQRGTLAGEMTIIVSTLQALRRDDTEGLKVYESNGALQHHFTGLLSQLEVLLERRPDGSFDYSLANVLRLWRPVVIMDEAHNARTPLSFDTLARFKPSCVIEFTATPETTYRPEQEIFASNILHHVSAAELKAEDMVKLPIKLETRADWKEALSEACQTQRRLEQIANDEEQQTGEYIRPIVLMQAQPRSRERQTLTVEVVRETLLSDFRIPENQIAIATGETRQIDNVDLLARECPIRFIITVAALKEGWDCAYAYVLCSVAEIGSARAVEQVLGRILRLPQAKRKQHAELNCAYAVAASPRFISAAQSLKDALVENGFQRLEVDQLVAPYEAQGTLFGGGTMFAEVSQPVPEAPNLSRLTGHLQERISFDDQTNTLTVTGVVSEADRAALSQCFTTPGARQAVDNIYHLSHGRPIQAGTEAPQGATIKIPALAIRVDGQLELFEESHFRDQPWKLSNADASLSETAFPSSFVTGGSGELDVSEAGQVEVRFIDQIQQQLRLLGMEPGWDLPGLVNWLDRQISHPDITRTEATLFIHRLLSELMESRGLSVEQLAQNKYRLRNAISERIDEHRRTYCSAAFNRLLWSQDAAEIEVSPEVCFELSADNYSPNWYYDGSYRWRKHFFPLVGELKAEGEEFECAVYLDQHENVKHWVRNLERRDSSFWLQTSTDKFYPDFVAVLDDDRFLVVEYKGQDRWSNDDSSEKRALGELWESRSNGHCVFVMPNGPDWQAIAAKVVRVTET